MLVETKVKQASYTYIANSILPNGWKESSTMEDGSTARIWMMWDPRLVQVTIASRNPQYMHCDVKYGTMAFLLSVCYGYNNYIQRRDLWTSITDRSKNSGLPRIVVGDFNAIRWTQENEGGAIPRAAGLIEFNDCIQEAGLIDLKLSEASFTWSNSSIGDSRIQCKLDRVLVNASFLHSSPFKGDILLPCISDHSPMLLSLSEKNHIKTPFRYYNYWAKMPGFFKTVKDAWDTNIIGTPLFIEVHKLSIVKKKLIEWKRFQNFLPLKISEATLQLDNFQKYLAENPMDSDIQEQERISRVELQHLLQAEESMYK